MDLEEFKKEMEKAKANPEEAKKIDSEEAREKAMKDYLDDVAPISEYINRGFEKLEAKKLTKKEGNTNGR